MLKNNRLYLYISIIVLLIWTLTPIYWYLKLAFLTPNNINIFPPVFLPDEMHFGAFINLFGSDYITKNGILLPASGQSSQVIRGLMNSFFVSVIATIITMIVIVPLAYTFSRLNFKFKTALLLSILLSVALPPISTLIPFFAMYVKLGLIGTKFGLIIVTLTITIPFVTWMLIGYFKNIPPIEKLGRIDGLGRFETFLKIFVPLSKNGILVAAVISFIFSWNEFTYASILVNGTNAVTFPTSISSFLFQHPHPQHLSAALFLGMLPPFIVAFFLQRYISEMNIVDPLR